MSDFKGHIKLEGMDQVIKALEAADKQVADAAMNGLEAAAFEIINDAKRNLRRNGSVITDKLRGSGHAERKGLEVTVGFFDTTNRSSGYALYYEFGRRAGKMPPPDDMAAWAYKKFHLKDWKVANSMGWAFAKKIAENGTQPHPFFVPAVNKNTKGGRLGGVLNSVTEAVAKVLRHSTAAFAAEARRIRNTPIEG